MSTFTCYVTEHLDPIHVKIAELSEALESVTLEQKYLRARDIRHRHSKPLFPSPPPISFFFPLRGNWFKLLGMIIRIIE